MKENYLYEQSGDMVAISAVTFDYHCIADVGYKLTQKKKIPSIRLAKMFCKALIKKHSHHNLVASERKSGIINTRAY